MSCMMRTLSAGTRVKNANKLFSGNVKPFTPGKPWLKPKRVTWNKAGVSAVKYFDYKLGAGSRQKGIHSSLRGPPASPIKNANPKEAQPFLIPTVYTAEKISKKNISKAKLLEKGFPTVDVDDLYPEEYEQKMTELREIYKACQELGNSPLYRTQPSRYNYCDN